MKNLNNHLLVLLMIGLIIGLGFLQTSAAAQAGTFVDSGQNLGGGFALDVALGDLDGDGDLDAFLANYDQPSQVWLNNGSGTFSDSGQTLGSAGSKAVALGDLDGDNDLDAFVANTGIAGAPNKVWINQGGTQAGTPGVFNDSGQSLGTAYSWHVTLGDLDGDNDLDAFVSNVGAGLSGAPNRVWLNNGTGIFSAGQGLGNAHSISAALGDLDGDSDLDAFIANWAGTGAANEIWLNNDSGTFSDSGQTLGLSQSEAVTLGDLDGDGDLDAFIANSGSSAVNANRVWLNDGVGAFSDSGQTLGNSPSNAVALGDLDGDGDLDAFVANDGPNKVWLNGGSGPPAGDTGYFEDSGQELGRADTASLAVALGDLDGDGDLDAVVGSLDWTNSANPIWLNDGTGAFSDSGQSLGDMWTISIALGDLDGDGDLDAFLGNVEYFGNPRFNQVWINQGGSQGGTPGAFSDSGQELGDSWTGSVALGDLDGDGDLDAFAANTGPNKVWLNDGTGTFSAHQNLGDSDSEEVALGDLDGDGDLDAFVVNDHRQANKVWLNDGTGTFDDSGQSLGANSNEDVALGDLDGDGDLDAFITKYHGSNEVWLNDGTGQFSDSSQELGDAHTTDVALGDLDGDGDLDAFVTNDAFYANYFYYGSRVNQVWENVGAGIFHEIQCLGNSQSTAVALGDLDDDGDLDAFVTNYIVEFESILDRIWLNGLEPESLSCLCTLEWLKENEAPIQVRSNLRLLPRSLLGIAAIDPELFYDLRDETLDQTPNGQRYTHLYYAYDREILELLIADSTLLDAGVATLELWQPNLQALLDGQGDTAIITAGQVQAIDDFLTNLSAAGSPELQQVIADELARLGDPQDFVGLSMEEARDKVIGYAVFLPLLQR